jgi:argonaute-like protein implicated in RNA metabolism and viral defense
MGGRPWILDKRLSADFYVGLDVGGEKKARVACYTFFDELGNYLGEEWRPQRAEEIDPMELKRTVVNMVKKHREHINSMVIHRDGEFTGKELEGVGQVKSDLIREGVMSDNSTVTCVNVKKTVPYRLYEVSNEEQSGCRIGSYLLLDAHSAILATSGVPLLRQGTARPLLIELVPPYDKENIKTTIQDIYYLSFMHWGSILLKMKLPATLRYADALTPFALRNIRVTGVPL